MFRSLVHFELIFIYHVDNLSFLFCELPFVSSPIVFSNQVFFFISIFKCSLYCIFVIYVADICHILLFRHDEKTKVLKNVQRFLQSHMAKAAVTKI